MSSQDYTAILLRLDSLERQIRWRRFERLLTLPLLGWLLISGVANGSLWERWNSVSFPAFGTEARAILNWSRTEARSFVTIKPVLDAQTVVDDEREAWDRYAEPAMSGQTEATAQTKDLPPQTKAVYSPARTMQRISAARPMRSGENAVKAASTLQTSNSVADPSTSPDLNTSVREAERKMALASEAALKLAGVVPGIRSAAVAASSSVSARAAAGSAGSLPASLPIAPPALTMPTTSGSTAAEAVPSSDAASAVVESAADPVTPVTLKALGYAQSATGAQAILTDGITMYVVNEGEEFADRFRVTAIRPEGLEIEDRRTNSILQLAYGH